MAKKVKEDVRNMTVPELEEKVRELRKTLFNMRSEAASGRIEKPHRFKMMKRDIARCLTFIKGDKRAGK